MREIKFRAWDNVDKKIIQVYNLCFDAGSSIYNNGNLVCMMGKDGNLYPRNRTEIMQYTGLKDKNGKEIYEGDILKWREGEAGKFYNKEVCWDKEQATFYLKPYYPILYVRMQGEIIGNIYENPELLKETTDDKTGK